MTNHTQEPWSCATEHADGACVYVTSAERSVFTDEVAVIYAGQSLEVARADARRIVACVNACAGIPTEALESGALAEVAQSIDDAIHCLERLPDVEGAYRVTCLKQLRDALAKLRKAT
jgi:hypothetical protein